MGHRGALLFVMLQPLQLKVWALGVIFICEDWEVGNWCVQANLQPAQRMAGKPQL